MLFFAFIAKANIEFGDSFTVNGITYIVISSNNKKEVKVGSNPAANGVVSIPSVVTNGEEDFDVVEIGGLAFDHCKKLKKILLNYFKKNNQMAEIDVEKVHGETVDAIFDLIKELA